MITQQQLDDLVSDINHILEEDRAKLKMSFHFAVDRLNDERNKPPITLEELKSIFETFIASHLRSILSEREGFSFTIKCNKSGIAIPCVIQHELEIGAKWVVQQVITIMRKHSFNAYHKDVIFEV